MEVGTRRRISTTTLRHALVSVPRQRRPDLLHDYDHTWYDHNSVNNSVTS